ARMSTYPDQRTPLWPDGRGNNRRMVRSYDRLGGFKPAQMNDHTLECLSIQTNGRTVVAGGRGVAVGAGLNPPLRQHPDRHHPRWHTPTGITVLCLLPPIRFFSAPHLRMVSIEFPFCGIVSN